MRTIERAENIIHAAETDLGPLDDGQRRDLLTDNTDWSRDCIVAFVAQLRKMGI